MFRELLFINNIAELFNCSESDAVAINKRLTDFINNYSTFYKWSNIKYINDLLLSYFSIIDSIQGDRVVIFYNLVFRYLGTLELDLDNLIKKFFNIDGVIPQLTSFQRKQLEYYIDTLEYLSNDLNISESDFLIVQDLFLFHIPVTLESGAMAKVENNTVVFLRPKDSGLTFSIEEALHALIDRFSLLKTPIIKNEYLSNIRYLLSIQDKLVVK